MFKGATYCTKQNTISKAPKVVSNVNVQVGQQGRFALGVLRHTNNIASVLGSNLGYDQIVHTIVAQFVALTLEKNGSFYSSRIFCK